VSRAPKFEPTPEQLEALRQFADRVGHGWKATLNEFWWTGTDANLPDGHLLRQVRNQGGPRWLAKFKL
jgi:hypothetical protein